MSVPDLAKITRPQHSGAIIADIWKFPQIPSISNIGEGKLSCTDWFGKLLSKQENWPGQDTAAGQYLQANGDENKQRKRIGDMIGYICDHDAKAQKIMRRVGDTIRRLLDRAMLIPQLLQENARLCECKPECLQDEPKPDEPKPDEPTCTDELKAQCCPPDLRDDQKLLMEQLAYMAMQMKRLTDSLGFQYDPATQRFYNDEDELYADPGSGFRGDMPDEKIHEMLGLDKAKVKELWDVLSSVQNNTIYNKTLDIYPEHKACDGTTVTTDPLVNVKLMYQGAEFSESEVDQIKLEHLKAYMTRLGRVSGSEAVLKELQALPEKGLAKLYEYMGVHVTAPPPQGGMTVTIRLPVDFMNTLGVSDTTMSVLGINKDTPKSGASILQTALTSMAIRPNLAEMGDLLVDFVGGAESAKSVGASFLTMEELKSEKPGVVDITGCMDKTAKNYNKEATRDDGSCKYDVPGCTDTKATNYNPQATVDDGSCILPQPEPEPEPEPEPKGDSTFAEEEASRTALLEEAAAEAKRLAESRAINYYARIRPFLKMDYGATVAQGMQAGTHKPDKENSLRSKAEQTAKNIDEYFSQNFSMGSEEKGKINAASRFKTRGAHCVDFAPVFKKGEFDAFHGHEVTPGFKAPKITDVSFNMVWDDRTIFDDERQGSVSERITKNNDEFLKYVWPNVDFFFTRPQNVIYVAYGASGAGKTTTTSAILANFLAKADLDKYSIRIVSDYLNRCYDFLSPDADVAYAALRSEEMQSTDVFTKELLNEQQVHNERTGEYFFNAHAIDETIKAQGAEGKAIASSKKSVIKKVAALLKTDATPAKVASALFREGNAKFAVGADVDKESPTKAIRVPRNATGAVDTQDFLTQFNSRPLIEILAESGVNTSKDGKDTQAKKLWSWLETRINVFRRRGNTGLNKTSSRSHVLYIITDETKTDPTAPGRIFVLADFAGTEDLRFLVPSSTQKMAQDSSYKFKNSDATGHAWYSVALPPQGGLGVTNSTAKDKKVVPLVMEEKLAKEKAPAKTISRLAKATFIQEASQGGQNSLVARTGKSAEALWKIKEPIHFLSTNVMEKLPPLQQESHQITRSLEQFKAFLKRHKRIVDSKGAEGVDCSDFIIDHHKPTVLNPTGMRKVIGYKLVEEPCLLVQKLLCPLITLDSSLVVLGAFAPRATDDLNSYNTATFISDCQCGDDGKMVCPQLDK